MAVLALGGWLLPPAQAEAPQALAILLQQLRATPIGLYDGVRLFRLQPPAGGSLTLSVSCEREQWRVQSSDSAQGQARFYDTQFLPAQGVARSWVCTSPLKALE